MYFNGTKCQLFILSCLLSVSALAKDVKTTTAGGIQKPLCFVENKGQVLDENHHSRTDIQYKLSGNGVSMFVGNGQLHYQFHKVEARKDAPMVTSYNMDVTLLGANTHAVATPAEKLNYYENYYMQQVGNSGVTANAYGKVTYTNVYPNIDWVLYLNEGKVEYDFVIRPGGNPKDIKIQYNGATDLRATENGGILAKTPMGDVAEDKLYAFETGTGKKVPSKYVVDGNIVSFETGKYTGSLTIDPYLQWSTYYGGSDEDVVTSVKCSAGGNVYATGYTASIDLPTLPLTPTPVRQTVFGGGTYDAFLVKYNLTGVMQFATYFGDAGTDMGMSVAIDYPGTSIFVGGHTTSLGAGTALSFALGSAPAGVPFQTANAGGTDMFLARFNNNGALQWSTYVGGTGNDEGLTVICDSTTAGNVFIAGSTQSTDMAATDATILNGLQDGYVAKFSNAGVYTWGTYVGGEGTDEIDAIAINRGTYLTATGQTNSVMGIATIGAYQTAIDGVYDAFITCIRTNLTAPAIIWSTYVGGSATEQGKGLASDNSHNIYLTGTTSSANAIASGISYTSALGGFQDAFLMKFDTLGRKKWGTYFGGINNDNGNSVCTDAFGNITIAGSASSVGLASTGAYQATLSGATDAFVAKYNTLGQKIYSTYFGNTGIDFANSVIADPGGNVSAIIIGGSTASSTGINSATTVAQPTYGGGTSDGFVSKFLRDTIVSFRAGFSDTLLCATSTFIVHDTVNYNFGTGNIFRVQLSDATGSFASPVVIGTSTTITAGAINATIPAGTTPGTGYRIGIVSTNPVMRSVDNNININIVATLPTPVITANNPVCVGSTLNLGVYTPYSVNGYSWTGPGFASTLQNPSIPSVTNANAGVYSVTVTHANGCPAASNSVTILVNSFIPPTPIATSNSPLCAGSTLSLFANPNYPTGIFTYHWTAPSGATYTSQNPTIPSVSMSDTGIYSLVDTLDGCASMPGFTHVVVNPNDTPNVVISVTPNDTVCSGTMLHFSAFVTSGGFSPQYQWLYGPSNPIVGAIFANYASASLANGANISCVVTSSVACPDKPHDTSNVITVTIFNNTPVVSIVASDTTISSGTTVTLTGYASGPSIVGYIWYVNNVAVPGATSSTLVLHNITHNDTVRFEVLSTGICASLGVSNTLIIRIANGVVNLSPEFNNIELFPNPNSGSFSVKGLLQDAKDGNVTLEATNMVGQVIYTGSADIINGQLDKSILLPNMPAGVYLLRVNKDGAGKVFRFVVE